MNARTPPATVTGSTPSPAVTAHAVHDGPALQHMLASWADAEVIGVDTEFVRERTYHARPGLLQFVHGSDVYLVDPLAAVDARALAGPLASARPLKVLHAAGEDLQLLSRLAGADVQGVFDTQVAAAFCGLGVGLGYHRLVQMLFDVELAKDQTRSDWLARPLSDEQLHYAVQDVAYLPAMHARLAGLLQARGMADWCAAENERLRTLACQTVDAELAYLRLKGVERLDPAGQQRLQRLAGWRERTALEHDVPRSHVLRDGVLLELARHRRIDATTLRSGELMHPGARRRYGAALLETHAAAARAVRERAPSGPLVHALDRDTGRRLLPALKRAVALRAAELELPEGLLASRRDLEAVLQAWDRAGRSAAGFTWPPELGDWREAAIGGAVRETLCADASTATS